MLYYIILHYSACYFVFFIEIISNIKYIGIEHTNMVL